MTKGLDIVLKDVSYERRALGYDLPVKSGCLGWWFLGGDLGFSAINLADEMPDAIVVGAPVVSPYYLSFKSKTNFLRTQQLLPANWTMVAVCRSLDTNDSADTRPIFIGTSDGNNAGGSMYASNTSSTAILTYQSDGSESTTLTGVTLSAWKCLIGSADENGQGIYNMSTGLSATEPQNLVGTALVPSVSKIGIGSGGGGASTFAGTSDIAMAAVYNRVLSGTERTAIYDRLKAYYGRRGITI